jgi:Mn2+/Fe2+ NRAMP family transporter
MSSAKKRPLFRFGPGALVTAAFIGPGTITTCSLAGAQFGYALLWGMVFSVVATIVLQEMSARLGIITRNGLGEALRIHFSRPASRIITAILVISAITIGNAAFQTGNILGASLGLQTLFGPELMKGMAVPSIPRGSVLMLVGLIGTTVVPYNLFLHASAVQERWQSPSDLPEARWDISISVILGGLISMAIIVTSAVAFYGTGRDVTTASDLAVQLEPLMGRWAKYVISTGLFAAGISSAITAPLAAAYATAGIMGWKRDLHSWRFRMIWMFILLAGILFSMAGFKPLEAILFAQAANGILLPLIAVYLLVVTNNRKIMGENVNTILSNILGTIVVLTALGLGVRSILHVIGII